MSAYLALCGCKTKHVLHKHQLNTALDLALNQQRGFFWGGGWKINVSLLRIFSNKLGRNRVYCPVGTFTRWTNSEHTLLAKLGAERAGKKFILPCVFLGNIPLWIPCELWTPKPSREMSCPLSDLTWVQYDSWVNRFKQTVQAQLFPPWVRYCVYS